MGTNLKSPNCWLVEAEGKTWVGSVFSCFLRVGTQSHTLPTGAAAKAYGRGGTGVLFVLGAGSNWWPLPHRCVRLRSNFFTYKNQWRSILVLIFQATPHICKCSSFDFERTCGSVCLSEHRCEACDTGFIPFS